MARVIRGAKARVIPAVIADARRQAEAILGAAHDEAERERARMRTEVEAEAREIAKAELAAAHAEVERARAEVIAQAQSSIAQIALAAARRIVGTELETHPERIRAIVQGAIDRVRRATRVRVRVHPSDAAQLVLDAVEVIEDASIERGGCVVESELGEVDARLEVRLDALERALRGERS